ncbi:hypothetical protein GCM10009557_66770 [Virgisporangium ochraceum]
MAKRRKVGNLLALALLTGLVEKPMHPYEMATLLKERGKDASIKIQWGSLYTVVQNLEKHGFVEPVDTTRQGKRPERTVYAITAAGRAELQDWLRELLAEPQQEFTSFEAALSNGGVLSPDEVIDLLQRRATTLETSSSSRSSSRSRWPRRKPPGCGRSSPRWSTARCPTWTCGAATTRRRRRRTEEPRQVLQHPPGP